jgi:cation transporter-like permease
MDSHDRPSHSGHAERLARAPLPHGEDPLAAAAELLGRPREGFEEATLLVPATTSPTNPAGPRLGWRGAAAGGGARGAGEPRAGDEHDLEPVFDLDESDGEDLAGPRVAGALAAPDAGGLGTHARKPSAGPRSPSRNGYDLATDPHAFDDEDEEALALATAPLVSTHTMSRHHHASDLELASGRQASHGDASLKASPLARSGRSARRTHGGIWERIKAFFVPSQAREYHELAKLEPSEEQLLHSSSRREDRHEEPITDPGPIGCGDAFDGRLAAEVSDDARNEGNDHWMEPSFARAEGGRVLLSHQWTNLICIFLFLLSHHPSSHSSLRQALGPLLISMVGLILAGSLLDVVQHWPVFEKIKELFILIPVMLNLKGNLEMTLASRLSTAANMGDFDSAPKVKQILIGNLLLLQIQSVAVGVSAAILSWILGGISHNGDFMTFSELVVIAACACFTASLSSLVLGGLMCGIVAVCHRFGINPDNVATPIASSLGDLVTLAIFAVAASGMQLYIGTFLTSESALCLCTEVKMRRC